MKKLILIFTLFLSGCASIGSNMTFSNSYTKKDNIHYQPRTGEFYDLKDKITIQEYRRLPNYLQTCYEKETPNG
jgi:PBP1b-binding outer membrane lipoprotein LpoB